MDFTTRFYFLFYESCRIFLRLVHYELEKFADGLATWIQALTAQSMPENWRDYLADELADWEDKGIIVQPHGLPALEKWILAKAKRRGTLPIGYRESEPGMVADRFADLARQYPSAVAVADTETAGFDRDSGVVYQETTPEFRAKVQRALEQLNPEVAAWWQSPQVNGLVRSYDQDDYPGSSPHHSFCLVENGQAIVVVDRRFTAGRTAQGIIYLAHSGLYLFPKEANFNFRPSFSPISAAVREMRIGRDPAVLESARSISIVAEMAVSRGAPLEDGTLTVRAKDKGDLTWRDLLRALAAHRLPPDVRALKILVPGRGSGPVRTIFLSAHLLRAFLQLPLADRQSIMAAASSVRPDEAQASIARGVAAKTPAKNARLSDHELAPSTELPYNQGGFPAAPGALQPNSLGDVETVSHQIFTREGTESPAAEQLLALAATDGTDPSGLVEWANDYQEKPAARYSAELRLKDGRYVLGWTVVRVGITPPDVPVKRYANGKWGLSTRVTVHVSFEIHYAKTNVSQYMSALALYCEYDHVDDMKNWEVQFAPTLGRYGTAARKGLYESEKQAKDLLTPWFHKIAFQAATQALQESQQYWDASGRHTPGTPNFRPWPSTGHGRPPH